MNKKDVVKSARINIATTPEIRKKVEELAKKERRSLSSTVEQIIIDAVKKQK